MQVKFGNESKHYRTVWMEDGIVYMINQRALPHNFEIFNSKTSSYTTIAIRDMTVRGAGAIGATAGYAIAQAALEALAKSKRNNLDMSVSEDFLNTLFWSYVHEKENEIKATRPTAQNLFYAVERVKNEMIKHTTLEEITDSAVLEAQKIADEDANACRIIGKLGEPLVKKLYWTKDKDTITILTHCNAGWLAFVDYGSALSPIYEAKRRGKKIRVLSDATTPRYQGAKLTCWELKNEDIEHYLIADTASGFLMSQGEVDLVIVGADRIAKNGDVANKIGTLQVATMAKHFAIPFYVAAPSSTIDLKMLSDKQIPIEYRSEEEVTCVEGGIFDRNGKLQNVSVQVPPYGTKAINPAFDVTPNYMIKKIITEKGIFVPAK